MVKLVAQLFSYTDLTNKIQIRTVQIHARTFYKDHLYKDQLVFVSKLRISTSWQFEG